MDTQTWSLQVKEYMELHHMAKTGDGILAAVSGGADSVCLLLVLKDLSAEMGFHLAVFHLNHGLRGAEADRDEDYVRELCRKLAVPLKVVREDVRGYAREHGLSEEEAGRILRYQGLEQAAVEFECNKIATAHHKDDDVETVLMNLFRGTGLRGLGGIRPVRENVIRPLLCISRQEIEEYLYKKKVIWCEDSTNQELQYARNKVRNILVPWVKENINDQAAEHILKTASLAAQADEYFAEQAEKLLGEECPSRIQNDIFDAQPEIIKAYLIRAMIANVSGSQKDISARHIESICGLTGPGGGSEADLPYGLKAVRGYEWLEVKRVSAEKECENRNKGTPVWENGRIPIDLNYTDEAKKNENWLVTRTFPWKNDMEIPKNQYTKWFDYDKIRDTLCVRTRENGDYFMIDGEKRKLLKRFFIDEKVPKECRDQILLLAEGNHILWIIGHRISESYKLSDTTRTVLEVRVCKGEKNG